MHPHRLYRPGCQWHSSHQQCRSVCCRGLCFDHVSALCKELLISALRHLNLVLSTWLRSVAVGQAICRSCASVNFTNLDIQTYFCRCCTTNFSRARKCPKTVPAAATKLWTCMSLQAPHALRFSCLWRKLLASSSRFPRARAQCSQASALQTVLLNLATTVMPNRPQSSAHPGVATLRATDEAAKETAACTARGRSANHRHDVLGEGVGASRVLGCRAFL